MKITQAEFVLSAVSERDFPKDNLPEIVFAGRSNVGKSSLINALGGRKDLAKISRHPGKTATLNFYLINRKLRFVDLPGYGYAKTSRSVRIEWKNMVESYFSAQRMLRLVLILVDARRGAEDEEEQLAEYLIDKKVPVLLVYTKSDKLNASEKSKIEKSHLQNIIFGMIPFVLTSAKDRNGMSLLLKMISEHVEQSV